MAGKRTYRARYRRLIELDKRIRADEYPNAFTFAKEWEVSRKTVVRDIEFLRNSMDAPIEFDPQRNGYFYTEPSWSLPQVQLTEGELLQLGRDCPGRCAWT